MILEDAPNKNISKEEFMKRFLKLKLKGLPNHVVFIFIVSGLFSSQQVINEKPKYGNFRFDLIEDVVIRESSVDEPYIFSKLINDLQIDSKGNLYILDTEKLVKFDSQGNFLKKIGRKGEGPGEYLNPFNIFIDNEDNVYVCDRGVLIIKYDPEGNFIDQIRLKLTIPFMPFEARNFFIDKEENIISFYREFSEKGADRTLIKSNKSGVLIRKIFSFPDMALQVKGKGGLGGVVGATIHAYTPSCYFCPLAKDRFCYGENTNYKIFIFDGKGEINKEFSLKEEPQPVTSSERALFVKSKDIFLPKYRPFFKAILCDEVGRIYVVRTKLLQDKSNLEEIDIFNAEGVYLYRARLNFLPRIIKNGYFYVIDQRSDGLREIKRLKIKNYRDLASS